MRWKASDWISKGVFVSKHPRIKESKIRRGIKSEEEPVSKKKHSPSSPSIGDGIEETLKRLFSECTRTMSAELNLGLKEYDRKLDKLTTKVVGMERSIQQLMDVRPQEQVKSNEGNTKTADPAGPVSNDPSPKTTKSSKKQDKPVTDRVLRDRNKMKH